LIAPFPYFGGKRTVVDVVWRAFGDDVRQYIEPFCGSAAILLGSPYEPQLQVAGDVNGYIANFWRAVKYQPETTWAWTDYPVSHIDLGARHRWLTDPGRVASLAAQLADPDWPGDAKIAGWWLWGQCAWIGSGWCEASGQVPHVSDAGMGVQAVGKVPHVSDAGRGVQAVGQVPHVGNAGMGVQAVGKVPHVGNAVGGAADWLRALSARLARVRLIHGDWTRCLNNHYGDVQTAIFFDPPYLAFEKLYCRDGRAPVALDVARWCAEHADLRVAICGHVGDYDEILPGWLVYRWERKRLTYSSDKTRDAEAIWFSPACRDVTRPAREQLALEVA
jgi:DNA adenine methylase